MTRPIHNMNELRMQRKNLKLQLQYQEDKLRQTANDLIYSYKFLITQSVIKNALISLIAMIKKKKKKKKKKASEKGC